MSYDLGTAHGKITLDYDGDRAIGRAEKDIEKLERKAKDGDKSVGRLGKTLGALGTGLKLGTIAIAFTNAAISASALLIQVAGMIPQLLSIASLSAALPAFYVGAAAAVGVLKAAFAGVGDAVTAAFDTEHPEKFEKALKELSPEAGKFALAVKAAVPALKGFQQEIQDTFFRTSALAGQVPKLVKAMGDIRPVLLDLTSDFGAVTKKVTDFALSAESVKFVSDAVTAFRAGLAQVTPSIVPVLAGLRAVGTVGINLLTRLGSVVGNVADKFAAWLTAIAADGRLQAWIDTALQTLQTLGKVIGNVGSILNSILTAANASGGGLLNTIAEITGQFAAFLKSAEGSEAIRSLFTGIMSVAKQLAPIFTTLVKVLAGALGPALQQIATQIGPVLLDVINRLAPAFGPLVAAAANLLTAVAPLLTPLAQLVALLAGVLTTAVQTLVAELGPLIEIFAQGLTQAFEAFMPVIAEMAKGLPAAAAAGVALAKAFAPLIPVVAQLAETLASTLIAVLPDLIALGQQMAPILIEFAEALGGALAAALQQITPLIPVLVNAFIALLPVMLQSMTIGLKLVTWALQFVAALAALNNAIQGFVQWFVSGFVGALTGAYNAVLSIGQTIINWFLQLPGWIMSALQALPGLIMGFFSATLNGLATLVGGALGILVGIFTQLPGRIMGAIASLYGTLTAFFSNLWAAIRNAATAAWNSIVSFIRALPGRIRSALAALPGQLSSLMRSAWNAARSAVVSGANALISYVRGIPGRIRSALGNVGGLLVSAGRSIVQGLINGISGMIGRVMSMVSNLASRVSSAFRSALSIFSPSKEFFKDGVNIGKGLILGLKDQLAAVGRMGQLLANTVIQPTVALPAMAGAAGLGVGAITPVRHVTDSTLDRHFGPYQMELDKDVVASFVVDTVTGNPTVVSKAADEGKRRKSWNGKGS